MTNETLLATILGFDETDEPFKNFIASLVAAVADGDPAAEEVSRVLMHEVEIVKAIAALTQDKDLTIEAMRIAKSKIASVILGVL